MKWIRKFFKDLIEECIRDNAFKITIEIKQNPDSIDKFNINITDCYFGNGMTFRQVKDHEISIRDCHLERRYGNEPMISIDPD